MARSGNKNFIKKILSPLLDLIFPKECLGCKKEGCFLCENCYQNIEINPEDNCVVCEKKVRVQNQICDHCLRDYSFDNVFVMGKYEGVIKNLIGAIKFDYIEEISVKIAKIFAKSLDRAQLADKLNKQVIIAIPLHKKRFLERGFNQAALIAAEIAEILDMNFNTQCMKRIKNTKQQANLKKDERIENMKQAFCASFDKVPETVYLFDDVFTTGQTMNEAARALKAAGVKQVNVLALAHGN